MSGCNVFEKVLGYFNPRLPRHCGDLGSVCMCVCDISGPRGALMSDAKMGRKSIGGRKNIGVRHILL